MMIALRPALQSTSLAAVMNRSLRDAFRSVEVISRLSSSCATESSNSSGSCFVVVVI